MKEIISLSNKLSNSLLGKIVIYTYIILSREKHFQPRNILSGVIPAGMYMSEKLPCIAIYSSITKEGTMAQINFLFIYFNMHLHRYLFKVLRIILPEILYIMIASYKIYFSIQSV